MQNQIFELSQNDLENRGAIYTSNEIYGQPELWVKTWDLIVEMSSHLQKFLNTLVTKKDLQIVLTGAGTSAYIGEVLEGPFQKYTERTTRAIPTTDIVTHP